MFDHPLARDLLVLIVAAVVGLIVAVAGTPKVSTTRPIWAVRLYLALLRAFPPFRASAPRTYSYREQFAAAFFVSFFIVFTVGVVLFGCGRLGCR
jgi:hypothetical protein